MWRVLLLSLILTGCAVLAKPAKPTVSPASIAEFFEVVETKDYHAMTRKGQETFKEGHYIPNYAGLFEDLPDSEPGKGQIRYVLYHFEGDASVGEVYLILEAATGKIVEFNHIEATLK